MEEVSLRIDGQVFKVKKNILCEHSDYFQAMFSGNYLENEQQEISIDVVDAASMSLIIKYMEIGLIDLQEYSFSTIGDLAMAANFLQITELIKQIEYCLEIQISTTNWMEILIIAENASYTKLEQLCAAFGLLSFRNMKPESITSIHKLCWYLSHSHLDAGNELNVFKFGFEWISHSETGADALLILLGCLDLRRLTLNELIEIKNLIQSYNLSLAAKVVDCLIEILEQHIPLSIADVTKHKTILCEKYTERVCCEVLNLIKDSRKRILSYIPMVPIWTVTDEKPDLIPHHMYTFSPKTGFERWLEIAEKSLWGWSVTAWGPMRLVMVCGEYGRGTGIFMKEVKVYDALKEEWVQHGVVLPSRRHAGVAVVDDSLFIVGGVGGFRVVLDTAIIYDLKQRSYRKIAKFPDALQNPAICAHEGMVYAAGHNNIYRYEDLGQTDRWVQVVCTDIRMSCMISFNSYIYCTQNYFSHLHRFKPGEDRKLDLIAYMSNPPAAVCNLGDRLLFFTRSMCARSGSLSVEEYFGNPGEDHLKVIFTQPDGELRLNDVAGSCCLVKSMPPVQEEVSQYHKRYLMMYVDH